MAEMAAGLSRAGVLRAYCSPASMTKQEFGRLSRVLPARFSHALAPRVLPSYITRTQNRRVGLWSEMALVAGLRARLPAERWRKLANLHAARFDRGVSRRLREGDRCVLAYPGTSIRTLQRARELGVISVLDYPITHHEYNRETMIEEADLVGDYAETLQGAEYEPQRWRQLEAEVASADYILTYCGFHRESFLKAGVPAERLLTHPLGVNTTLFRPLPRPSDGVFRVLFSGQITQRKGISYLVEGFRLAAIPQSELVMIGRPVGPTDPWIRAEGVRHIPAVRRSQLPNLYAMGDVYVMPSLLEGFNLTAMEAMAMGLPTITTPNTFDAVTDGVDGFVVPVRDPDSIANRLRWIYENPDEAAGIGAAARSTAERYTWQSVGDGVTRLLRSVSETDLGGAQDGHGG